MKLKEKIIEILEGDYKKFTSNKRLRKFCTFFRKENMLLDINLSAICTILYYLYLSHI